jgi:hypothetical protein
MIATLVRKVVGSKAPAQPMALKRVLTQLDITPFTPESVAQYKREKLEQVEAQLRPANVEEIKERDFSHWEYCELRRLHYTFAKLTSDEPAIRFWKTPQFERFYTYLQWVKTSLEKAVDVPEFVKAKAEEIANLLPDATFAVEELRSERRAYDPFLIVSYGDESYYVDVWGESNFECKYT